VQGLVESCPWHNVYDIAEEFYRHLDQTHPEKGRKFEHRLNDRGARRTMQYLNIEIATAHLHGMLDGAAEETKGPSKGEPVFIGSDAGGPNGAKGIVGPDLDQNYETPPPSYRVDKPGKKENDVPTEVRVHRDTARLKGGPTRQRNHIAAVPCMVLPLGDRPFRSHGHREHDLRSGTPATCKARAMISAYRWKAVASGTP